MDSKKSESRKSSESSTKSSSQSQKGIAFSEDNITETENAQLQNQTSPTWTLKSPNDDEEEPSVGLGSYLPSSGNDELLRKEDLESEMPDMKEAVTEEPFFAMVRDSQTNINDNSKVPEMLGEVVEKHYLTEDEAWDSEGQGHVEGQVEGQDEGQVEGQVKGQVKGQDEGQDEGQREDAGHIEGQDEGQRKGAGQVEGEETTSQHSDHLMPSLPEKWLGGKKLSQVDKEQYKTAFDLFDRDNDGKITEAEFQHFLRELQLEVPPNQLMDIMYDVDVDGTCNFNFDEFLYMMENVTSSKTVYEEMTEAFRVFDRDNDGYISAYELKQVLTVLGEQVTDEQAQAMIRDADSDGDGFVNYPEFVNALIQFNKQ